MDDTYCEKRSTIVVDLVPSELFQISNIVKMTTFVVISLRLFAIESHKTTGLQ